MCGAWANFPEEVGIFPGDFLNVIDELFMKM